MADFAGVNGTRKEFKVVGKPNLPGVLSWAQATGVAKFGVDYVVPNMLHAKFLRSPYANARIKKLDTTKANAIPGVVDIITWEDANIKKLSSGGDGGFFMGSTQAFLDNQADQEGAEAGAIVVAESEDICEEALRAAASGEAPCSATRWTRRTVPISQPGVGTSNRAWRL